MSEQRAKYKIESKVNDQEKPQPVSLTLNSEQIKGVLHCVAQKSPRLIVAETVKALARDPEQLQESDAAVLLKVIIQRYPTMAQKVMNDMDNRKKC